MTGEHPAPTVPAAPTREQIRRWRRYLADERMERDTYRFLAQRRSGEEAVILEGLAKAEERHASYWANKLGDHATPEPRPSIVSRFLSTLARSFGSIFVLALVQRSEQRGDYDDDEDATAQMAADEHIHSEVVRGLAQRSRDTMSGTFRAAVFGANDGLVSNLALILGIAATGTSHMMVVISGVAGLLAGALSMAAGEYISVTSQRELLEASDPAPDAHRAVASLDVDENELELVFRARGDSPEDAAAHARLLFSAINRPVTSATTGTVVTRMSMLGANAQAKARAHAEEEQHVEIGTARTAAVGSFVFFSAGAFLPLLPFLLGASGVVGIVASAVVVGCALMVTGGVTGILSGRAPLLPALRQLAIGYGAAAITYLLGTLFGVSTV